MDKEEGKKPKEILELEKKFSVKLTKRYSLQVIREIVGINSYMLDKKNKIIGLNIRNTTFSDFSLVEELKNLIVLNLSENKIEKINLKKLKHLRFVDLRNNKIKYISFDNPNLEGIVINQTPLERLEILNGENVKRINLAETNLNDISLLKEIINYPQIENLILYNSFKQTLIPRELFGEWLSLRDLKDGCLNDLKNYFQNQDFVPNKEIKVVILGNGMVGKSTLLNRFLNPTGDWEKEIQIDVSDRTEGVAIERKEDFKLEGNEKVNLNIWDFGGQEVYHGTHRLFLDKDAVYIIVWTLETDEKEYEIRQDLDYWLDYAQDLAIDSPIILVHSQCEKDSDEKRQRINKQIDISEESKYKENIVENYLPFSAKKKIGVEELDEAIKKAITETNLSTRIKTKIPKKWSDLRDELRKLSKGVKNKKAKVNEISKQNYQDFCDKYKIGESEAETVLTFLHRTGFLYYDTQLSNNIILNQTWAIEAIYEALKPSGLVKDKNGKISSERLKRLWIEKGYSEEEAKTFINFMVNSEICFCKEQQYYWKLENPTFIVPHYLEEPNPLLIEWDKPNSFYMIYKPQFFHKGIAERFLSRLGRLSGQNALWKDGILLKSDIFSSKALITFDREKKEVNISTENYELLEAILKELNKILDEGSQTNPSEKVTFFYSLDGKEFVEKKKLMTQIEDDNQFVRTVNNKKVEVKDFAEKYRLKETQKTISEKSHFEEEGKQAKNPLIEEANNKVISSENSKSQTTNQNTYFMTLKDDEQNKGIHLTVNVDAGIKDSFKDFGKSQQNQNQSQQIDFKAFENSLVDLQRNLGYAKQEIEEKINKECENSQLIEARQTIEKTIDAAEQIEEDAEKAVEGDKKAEKNIKKDKSGFFKLVENCSSYIPKLAGKAINPKTWENAQKSLEAAGKFGEQLGNMM
ncbi:COR domain-containing protein [Bernardetia sp. Wsw4-3y2]|uniref:COR domain-containing protein n=1 Tax=Bernardetia sp. Wsw4-3y2 TaxID=3127471 RepID=UPI0030D3B397